MRSCKLTVQKLNRPITHAKIFSTFPVSCSGTEISQKDILSLSPALNVVSVSLNGDSIQGYRKVTYLSADKVNHIIVAIKNSEKFKRVE